VVDKLRFVHRVIASADSRGNTQAGEAAPPPIPASALATAPNEKPREPHREFNDDGA
jgi:hypothetical protein